MQKIIHIEDGVARMPEWRMAEPVSFDLCDGEHIAIIGPNGGGKSMLVDILTGKHPLQTHGPEYDFSPGDKRMVCDNIKYITFRDTYGGDDDRAYFLQLRWNQHALEDVSPKVLMSSGELRRYKLSQALAARPRVLIIDNPFIGLDTEARARLRTTLARIAAGSNLQLILVLSRSEEIPDFITHVVEVSGMKVGKKVPKNAYQAAPLPQSVLSASKHDAILSLPYGEHEYSSAEVIRMNKASIRYGERTILKELDWVVRNGERWALTGRNGSGKSTLLSLVCADNPQSYACDISLFGRQRGSGESIWDIKRHIGYVSPEMHRACRADKPCLRMVASGLSDYAGLYVNPKEEDCEKSRFWMEIFGIGNLAEKTFLKVSSGEQRLVLLARAFVRDPGLLILDEPLHGLDDKNRALAKNVIDAFCERRNKTFVMVSHYEEEFPACIDHRLVLGRN